MTEQNTKVDNLNHVQRYFYLRDGKNRRNICFAVLRQKGKDFTQVGVAVWNPKDSYDKGFAREVALKRAQKAYVCNSVQPFRRDWNSFTIASRNGIPRREHILQVILRIQSDNTPGKLIRAAKRAECAPGSLTSFVDGAYNLYYGPYHRKTLDKEQVKA